MIHNLSVFMLGSQVRVTTRRFKRSSDDDADQWQLVFEEGLQGRPLLTQATGTNSLTRYGTRVSVKLSTERFERMFAHVIEHQRDTEAVLRRGNKLLRALVGWLCPASEVALHAQFADAPRAAVVAPNDWMRLGQKALARRVHCEDKHLVPLRDESGALFGRLGLEFTLLEAGGALVLHGVRCGEMPGLVGLALASENNRDARRTDAAVAGSLAAWSEWAEQVLDGLPNQEIKALLMLHPLLRDHDLPVWRFGAHAVALVDLVASIVDCDELRIHVGDVSHDDDDDMSSSRFDSGFKLSDDLIIMPRYRPGDGWWGTNAFPWLLGVAAIDYESRLEGALTGIWRGFEKHKKDDAVVGEVEGIEIYRSVTVYRRTPTA